jgi:hypothetical protein
MTRRKRGGTWDPGPEPEEEDALRSDEWEEAKRSDRERLLECEQLAIASCVPGWVATMIGGKYTWMTCDVAYTLARELREAARISKSEHASRRK